MARQRLVRLSKDKDTSYRTPITRWIEPHEDRLGGSLKGRISVLHTLGIALQDTETPDGHRTLVGYVVESSADEVDNAIAVENHRRRILAQARR